MQVFPQISTRESKMNFEEKNQNHPCFNKAAHNFYARMHLPVAPACNIQCNYCNRKFDCSNESRPGVTSSKLKPVEAVKKALFTGAKLKNLSVVGIAGPGDALANPKQTFETLELLKKHAPDLKPCVSTNGLMLPFYAKRLAELEVDHLTVTMNFLDPAVGAKIYDWVYDTKSKKRYKGEEGAELLLNRQLKGVETALDLGMVVKINSVLIQGINDEELPKLSKKLQELGIFLHNIMPHLCQPEFGTNFAKMGLKSTTQKDLKAVQEKCGTSVNLMKHCSQCRSDAVGLLGRDEKISDEFMEFDLDTLAQAYDVQGREQFHKELAEFSALASQKEAEGS